MDPQFRECREFTGFGHNIVLLQSFNLQAAGQCQPVRLPVVIWLPSWLADSIHCLTFDGNSHATVIEGFALRVLEFLFFPELRIVGQVRYRYPFLQSRLVEVQARFESVMLTRAHSQ